MSLVRSVINKAYSFFIKKTALRSAKVGKAFRCQRPFSMGGNGCTIGDNVTIGKGSALSLIQTYGETKYQPHLEIGSGVVVTGGLKVLCAEHIRIGDNTLFGSDVFISDENHGLKPWTSPYQEQPLATKEVIIQNNCWIGERAVILPGSVIGEWSIIGAGAVVKGTVPPMSIVVGNPARVVKRYDPLDQCWHRLEDKTR